jgi:predicted nucleic acid-binding protein
VAIFVDTGAWYAASVANDPDHAAASAFMRSNRERLVTSDYIYDELLTLYRARRQLNRAHDWVSQVRQGRCEVIRLTDSDLLSATDVYFKFFDKEWSFTDCTSRVLTLRLRIQCAFSIDEHFRQFGTLVVVP